MNVTMKFKLRYANQMRIIVKLYSFSSGRGMFKMWDVRELQHLGCKIFDMRDVRDVGF